jgi:hypothetical protein
MPITPMQKLLSGVVLPLVAFAQLTIIWIVHWLSAKFIAICHPSSDRGRQLMGVARRVMLNDFPAKNRYARTFVGLYLFSCKCSSFNGSNHVSSIIVSIWVLPIDNSIARTVLKFLDCMNVTDDVSVVAAYPAINCSSSSYTSLYPLFIVLLIVVVLGTPIIMLLLLIRMNKQNWLSKLTLRYGILYQVYKPDRYWWEFIVLLR